jgi:Zn-dependent protease with chaperone function
MNFFDRQRQVRRSSWRLVLLFSIAVIAIIVSVDLVVVLLFGGLDAPTEELLAMLVVTSLLVGALIGFSSLFKMIGLRSGGGSHVARSLGAMPVPQDTTDPQLRRLRNVVEEVAIASGTPVPALFVMEGEPGINAFAAGWSPSDAAVAVTRGALERLNRDELQGVIAHEFSHVVNGDMRLNIRLMGLLFGILVLAIIGRVLLRIRGGQRNPLPLVGLALIIIGGAGIFIGRMIKAAVSRQREFLADASAVQFTRQTSGLTGALQKIGGLPAGSNLNNAKAEDVSHMLFGSGKGFSGMFATHPPLVKRIQALDPSFRPEQLRSLAQKWSSSPPSGLAEDRALGLAGARDVLPPADATVAAAPAAMAANVGAPAASSYQRASAILEQIPEGLRDRAHRADSVVPLVFGLLLSANHDIRTNQHGVLAARHGREVADAAWREAESLKSLHPMLRLPLAEVAFPALRQRPRQERDTLMDTVYELVRADGRLSIAEYCLSRLLHEELYEVEHREPPWGRKRYALPASRAAAAKLLSTLAQAGHDDDAEAEAAFHAGVARLFPGQRLAYAPPEQGVMALETVWPPLDGLNAGDKQLLVEALVDVISHAGEIRVAELELLRTICAMLHCPLPQVAHEPGDVRPSAGTDGASAAQS